MSLVELVMNKHTVYLLKYRYDENTWVTDNAFSTKEAAERQKNTSMLYPSCDLTESDWMIEEYTYEQTN
jgi:hypothetical protein